MAEDVVAIRGISKRFGVTYANKQVDFTLQKGSIHGLLGENGAGKTTLMNILYGLYYPDAGAIYIRGRKVNITSPQVAIALGIGMVHQHFMLVRPLTVVENVVLGLPSGRGPWLDLKRAARRLEELAHHYKLEIDPFAKIWQLSVGQQQRVEILTALYRGAEILILDEPTAVLTPGEIEGFFSVLRAMRDDGKAVVLISHKLEEIMQITDQCTVLRDGRVVGEVATASTTPAELAHLMVGREISFDFKHSSAPGEKCIFSLEGISCLDDRSLPAVDGIDLALHEGEILGLAGVDGNGQKELCEVVTGLRPAASGRIKLGDLDLTNRPPGDFIAAGIAYIPEDRQRTGLAMNFSVMRNFFLKNFHQPAFSGRFLLDLARMQREATQYVAAYDIKTGSLDTPVKNLSGGNQQKIILARELSAKPRVIIAHQPTRGLDIGATAYVRQRLVEERERGAAILLVSTDLEEIWQLADRIAVIYKGRLMGIVAHQEATIQAIGLMMAGSTGGKVNDQAG
ncbi:ABC transporter ATP-binding protein [Moorella naiadis]|uniref:ABC transporter ATP-binding protein n=1 Tax=Moorella naiadis (nom. illeg.) TaxID=3093670 RepID=UPI003D9CBDAC